MSNTFVSALLRVTVIQNYNVYWPAQSTKCMSLNGMSFSSDLCKQLAIRKATTTAIASTTASAQSHLVLVLHRILS